MNRAAQSLGRKGGKAGRGASKARPSDQMRAAAAKRWANSDRMTASQFQTLSTVLEKSGWRIYELLAPKKGLGWIGKFIKGEERFTLDDDTKGTEAFQRAIGVVGGAA